jgi:hypothetical protein
MAAGAIHDADLRGSTTTRYWAAATDVTV